MTACYMGCCSKLPGRPSANWAVAVAAGVVGGVKVPAGATGVHVAAQGGGAAVPDGRQRAEVVGRHFGGGHQGQETADNIRQFMPGAHHLSFSPARPAPKGSGPPAVPHIQGSPAWW